MEQNPQHQNINDIPNVNVEFEMLLAIHKQQYESHSFIYRILFYLVAFSTIHLLFMFKSPAIIKRIMDKFYNIKITLFKTQITVYFIMLICIFTLIITFFSKTNYFVIYYL